MHFWIVERRQGRYGLIAPVYGFWVTRSARGMKTQEGFVVHLVKRHLERVRVDHGSIQKIMIAHRRDRLDHVLGGGEKRGQCTEGFRGI